MMDSTLQQLVEEMFRLRAILAQLQQELAWRTQERDDLAKRLAEPETRDAP